MQSKLKWFTANFYAIMIIAWPSAHLHLPDLNFALGRPGRISLILSILLFAPGWTQNNRYLVLEFLKGSSGPLLPDLLAIATPD